MGKQFDDNNFETEVIEASKAKPVLVDFFASWCGPCRMQGPIVEEVAEAMGDKAIVGKLDTEAAQATAIKYGVMSIPNIMIFRNGEVVENIVGVQPKGSLIAVLEKHM